MVALVGGQTTARASEEGASAMTAVPCRCGTLLDVGGLAGNDLIECPHCQRRNTVLDLVDGRPGPIPDTPTPTPATAATSTAQRNVAPAPRSAKPKAQNRNPRPGNKAPGAQITPSSEPAVISKPIQTSTALPMKAPISPSWDLLDAANPARRELISGLVIGGGLLFLFSIVIGVWLQRQTQPQKSQSVQASAPVTPAKPKPKSLQPTTPTQPAKSTQTEASDSTQVTTSPPVKIEDSQADPTQTSTADLPQPGNSAFSDPLPSPVESSAAENGKTKESATEQGQRLTLLDRSKFKITDQRFSDAANWQMQSECTQLLPTVVQQFRLDGKPYPAQLQPISGISVLQQPSLPALGSYHLFLLPGSHSLQYQKYETITMALSASDCFRDYLQAAEMYFDPHDANTHAALVHRAARVLEHRSNPILLDLEARHYLTLGAPAVAARKARRALQHNPLYAPAHYRLAQALWELQQPSAAAQECRRAQLLNQQNVFGLEQSIQQLAKQLPDLPTWTSISITATDYEAVDPHSPGYKVAAFYWQATRLTPERSERAKLIHNLALYFHDQDQPEGALAEFAHSLAFFHPGPLHDAEKLVFRQMLQNIQRCIKHPEITPLERREWELLLTYCRQFYLLH